ncbi:non-specific lipid-transfer protein-like protein At2g13820 [Phalaenopsis equestris]|uniref:non-specific lipid-transfer protein-like protein At2g13820 n=1 Tax=Phalaenopsis equestris TaxID=78828 RepID=UPI0009E6347A|nr:non-specific lipid-transfer protein-like protein At2g13820 [Phalaenopsis equestris]
MEKGAMKIFLLATAVIAASFWIPAASQSSCTTVLLGLSPCLNYIIGSSSTASSSCCSQLGNVVQSQPQCLCTLINGGVPIISIALNRTRALALPGACNIQTPPVSLCKVIGGGPSSLSSSPTESPQAEPSTLANPPTSSEAPSDTAPSDTPPSDTAPSDTPPSDTPLAAVSPSGNGSKSTKGDSSDGRMNKSVLSIVFSALIFGISLASFF